MSDLKNLATIVITSCDRPEFLEQTLNSIMTCDLSGIKRIIVIEDSTNPTIGSLVSKCIGSFPHLFLQNDENIGQIQSVDRAYAEVDTPYIYHCEEDWLFSSSLFLEESIQILETHPKTHAVMVRDPSENGVTRYIKDRFTSNGCSYGITCPKKHRRWGSFSFNPGLRRTLDYKKIAPYKQIGPERDISLYYKLRGYGLAIMDHSDVVHIGHVPSYKFDEIKRKQSAGYLLKSLKHRLQFLWFRAFG